MIWVLILVLCPIAYIVGIHLEFENSSHHHRYAAVERSKAIGLAHQFALLHGIQTSEWKEYCLSAPQQARFLYLEEFQNPAAQLASQLSPAVPVHVLLVSPDGKQWATVDESLDGRVTSYDFREAQNAMPVASLDDEGLLGLARSVLQSKPGLASVLPLGRPEVVNLVSQTLGPLRRYVWRTASPAHPELRFQMAVTVRGNAIVGESYDADVDSAFVRNHLSRPEDAFEILELVYSLLIAVLTFYSVMRFIRRTMAKEASLSRTMLVGSITGLFILFNVGSGYDATMYRQIPQGSTVPGAVLWLIFSMIALGGGLLFGVAYGSAEGDLREAYPGKMTSLDALILGRVFSANVARSWVFGVAITGWVILFQSATIHLLHEESGWHAVYALQLAYMRLPLAHMVLNQPMAILLGTVVALMLPLTFVYRNVRRPGLRMALLLPVSFLALSGPFLISPSLSYFFVSVVFCLVCLLIPFFRFDLLSSMLCYGMYVVINGIVRLTPFFPGYTTVAGYLAAATVLLLAIQVWRSYQGHFYCDEAVRPVYARHLAERLSLQAEVAAAREAQLRLLPESSPDAPGLSIAAFCLPASVVGGDFYDFFRLTDGRIGIFVAEGTNRGLASALTIALAKGFLMHSVHSTQSPAEIIMRLERTLGGFLVEGCARASIAYAVLDPSEGMLRYARTGTHPRLLLIGPSSLLHERIVTVVGRDIESEPIWEGEAQLEPGASVLFYTRGLDQRLSDAWGKTPEVWRRRLSVRQEEPADRVRELIISTAVPKRRAHQPADLTAVVVRLLSVGEKFMEGVA